MLTRLKPLSLEVDLLDKYLIKKIRDTKLLDKLFHTNKKEWQKVNNSLTPYSYDALEDKYKIEKYKKISVEFCCGVGDFLVHNASKNPNTFFIGVDVALPCVQRGINYANREKLENIAFYNGLGEDFIFDLQNILFDEIMINFPDPWPKKRHFNRRIIKVDFIQSLLKILKTNSFILVATDVKPLWLYHQEIFNTFIPLSLTEVTGNSTFNYYDYSSRYAEKKLSGSEKIFYSFYKKV